jgi:predicted transcriptional regulator
MKRCKEEIIEDILELCIEPASKSKIVHQGNLNFSTVNPYIDRLVSAGFLKILGGTYPIMYKTTPKGMEMLEHIKGTMDYLDHCPKS